MAWRRSSFEAAAIVSLPAIGILVTRPEIRPEAFSYLLATIFLWLLWRHRSRALPPRALFALPALMLLWVNLHIYFFFGLMLIGLFLCDELWTLFRTRSSPARVKILGIVLAAASVATLANPAGLRGALYPFRIFGNYGHTIFENQPLLWVEANYGFPAGIYFKLAFALLVLSWVYAFAARREISPALLVLSLVLSVLGWQAIRNFGIFGCLALPITAANFGGIEKRLPRAAAKPAASALMIVLVACGLVALRPGYWTGRGPVGIGLRAGGTARPGSSNRNGSWDRSSTTTIWAGTSFIISTRASGSSSITARRLTPPRSSPIRTCPCRSARPSGSACGTPMASTRSSSRGRASPPGPVSFSRAARRTPRGPPCTWIPRTSSSCGATARTGTSSATTSSASPGILPRFPSHRPDAKEILD